MVDLALKRPMGVKLIAYTAPVHFSFHTYDVQGFTLDVTLRQCYVFLILWITVYMADTRAMKFAKLYVQAVKISDLLPVVLIYHTYIGVPNYVFYIYFSVLSRILLRD